MSDVLSETPKLFSDSSSTESSDELSDTPPQKFVNQTFTVSPCKNSCEDSQELSTVESQVIETNNNLKNQDNYSNDNKIGDDDKNGDEFLSQELLNRLKSLKVKLQHQVPPQHSLENLCNSRFLSPREAELFKLYGPLRKSLYTKEEDDIIKQNWQKFCEVHKWESYNVKPFVHMRNNNKYYISDVNSRKDFMRFLANGLASRSLYSVYHRFGHLYSGFSRKGEYSPKENKFILSQLKNRYPPPDLYAKIARELGRSRHSVWMKARKLKNRLSEDSDSNSDSDFEKLRTPKKRKKRSRSVASSESKNKKLSLRTSNSNVEDPTCSLFTSRRSVRYRKNEDCVKRSKNCKDSNPVNSHPSISCKKVCRVSLQDLKYSNYKHKLIKSENRCSPENSIVEVNESATGKDSYLLSDIKCEENYELEQVNNIDLSPSYSDTSKMSESSKNSGIALDIKSNKNPQSTLNIRCSPENSIVEVNESATDTDSYLLSDIKCEENYELEQVHNIALSPSYSDISNMSEPSKNSGILLDIKSNKNPQSTLNIRCSPENSIVEAYENATDEDSYLLSDIECEENYGLEQVNNIALSPSYSNISKMSQPSKNSGISLDIKSNKNPQSTLNIKMNETYNVSLNSSCNADSTTDRGYLIHQIGCANISNFSFENSAYFITSDSHHPSFDSTKDESFSFKVYRLEQLQDRNIRSLSQNVFINSAVLLFIACLLFSVNFLFYFKKI